MKVLKRTKVRSKILRENAMCGLSKKLVDACNDWYDYEDEFVNEMVRRSPGYPAIVVTKEAMDDAKFKLWHPKHCPEIAAVYGYANELQRFDYNKMINILCNHLDDDLSKGADKARIVCSYLKFINCETSCDDKQWNRWSDFFRRGVEALKDEK